MDADMSRAESVRTATVLHAVRLKATVQETAERRIFGFNMRYPLENTSYQNVRSYRGLTRRRWL